MSVRLCLLSAGLLAIASAPRSAHGSPTDCSHWQQTATTQSLMNACSAKDARRSGTDVEKRYLAYRETLAAGRRAALDATQKAWAKYRDTYCGERGAAVSGGSIQPLVINTCMDTLNRRRAFDLASDSKNP